MGFPKKLTDEQRLMVCRLSAEGRTPTEVVAYIKEEWKISFTTTGIQTILKTKRYQVPLKQYRENYLKRIKDVPIANKRLRLDDLQFLREKYMKALRANPCETRAQRDEFRALSRSLNEVIISSREEMEKKPNLIPGFGLVGDLSDKSDEELIGERDEILKQTERLIHGRTPGVNGDSEGAGTTDQEEPS